MPSFLIAGAAADNGDTPEQTQVKSEGSLLSDEGLELSHIHSESMFQGPELDGDSEDIVKGKIVR